jgi:hypothetical protein
MGRGLEGAPRAWGGPARRDHGGLDSDATRWCTTNRATTKQERSASTSSQRQSTALYEVTAAAEPILAMRTYLDLDLDLSYLILSHGRSNRPRRIVLWT